MMDDDLATIALGHFRIRDAHHAVHLARATDCPGTTLCGYENGHLAEEVTGRAAPGQPLSGELCAACLASVTRRPDPRT